MVTTKSFTKSEMVQGLKQLYGYDDDEGCLRWRKGSPENGIHPGDKAGRMKKGDFVVSYRGKNISARRVVWLLNYDEFPTQCLYVRDGNPENMDIENIVCGKDLRRFTRVCQQCKQEFHKKYVYADQKYCSRGCYAAAKAAKRPTQCLGCGETLADAESTISARCTICKKSAARIRQLARLYGMTVPAFEALLASQDYGCAICKEAPDDGPVVDHCHTTKAVRGILCKRCNLGLGNFRDNAAFLQTAIEYLGKGA